MKSRMAKFFCLMLFCIGGCSARSEAENNDLNAQLQAEKANNAALTAKLHQASAANADAQEKTDALSKQLDLARKQLADEHQNVEKLRADLTDAQRAKSVAEEQRQKALADSESLSDRLAQRGTLRNIDDAVPLDATVPNEIRNAFRDALAWRANQVQSLEIQIRDTPSKAEAKAMRIQLEKLKSSPLTPPRLTPSNLTMGQIGPLQINDHLRVDAIVGENTLIVTPIKNDPTITPRSTPLATAEPNVAFVREEGNPIALHGFPTKGVVTGAKITELPGLYYVEKTQPYGSRTIFVLAPVDANKLRAYFTRLQAELRATGKPKLRDGSEAASK
jgi:hypothetical protein